MSEPVRGVIVAHSSLALGLAAAVKQIAGVGEETLHTLSNEGHGPEGLMEAVRAAMGDGPTILFTDLASGSCAFAARRISLERPATGIVMGVNLAILLDFVFHRDLPLNLLVDRLVEKGKSGINGSCTEEGARGDRLIPR
jgi:mannose/fructose-specific phosphotransferase system component IIA